MGCGPGAARGGWSVRLPPCTASMVGRSAEFRSVVSRLAGGPCLVWIDGEAGVGKSRLLEEALRDPRISGLTSVVVACPPFAQPWTLGPIVDALRLATDDPSKLVLSPVVGALAPLVPEWRDRLPEAPSSTEGTGAAQPQIFRAIAEVIAAAGVELLAIEDLHWADPATVELLSYLAASLPRGPRLVVTCRLEDLSPDAPARSLTRRASGSTGVTVSLRPLDKVTTESLARTLLGSRQVTAAHLARLTEQSDGIPFAVEEMVRLVLERPWTSGRPSDTAEPGDDVPGEDLEVPTTIRETVLSRVGRLPDDAVAVLRAISVWGDQLTEDLVRELTGYPADRVTSAIGAGLDSGILSVPRPGWLCFRHALAAVAVYDAAPAAERRTLHANAAGLMSQLGSASPARIAEHYLNAGSTGPWREWAQRAADLALSVGDEATATQLLGRLVADPSADAQDLAGLMDKIPFSALTDPTRSAHLLAILRARLGAGNLLPADEAAIRWQLGRALTATDNFEAGQTELELALRHLDRDSPQALRAMGVLATPFGSTRTRADHLRWLREGLARPLAEDSTRRLAVLVDQVAAMLLLGEEGGWSRAELMPEDSPRDRDRVSIAFGNVNIADQAMVRGRFDLATQRLEAARASVKRHGYPNVAAALDVTQLHLDWFSGRWQGLVERGAALVDSDLAPPLTKLEARLVLGLLTMATGSAAAAERQLRAVLDDVPRRGAVWTWMEPAAALARLLFERGLPEDALRLTDEPTAVVDRKGTWVWSSDLAPSRVRALVLVGRLGEAADLIDACTTALVTTRAPALEAAVLECRAVLAEAKDDPDRAERHYEHAARAWDAIPMPYAALRAREGRARYLLGSDPDVGRQDLVRVLRGYSRLGATRDAARLAQELRRLGVPVRRPGAGRPSYGTRLSPRELEVVQLAAAGETNKEIAAVLSRSPRTVAGQLSAAMRKLGVSSRGDLGQRLASLDDDDISV